MATIDKNSEMIPASKPSQIGDQLPQLRHSTDVLESAIFADWSGNHHRIHWDHECARSEKRRIASVHIGQHSQAEMREAISRGTHEEWQALTPLDVFNPLVVERTASNAFFAQCPQSVSRAPLRLHRTSRWSCDDYSILFGEYDGFAFDLPAHEETRKILSTDRTTLRALHHGRRSIA